VKGNCKSTNSKLFTIQQKWKNVPNGNSDYDSFSQAMAAVQSRDLYKVSFTVKCNAMQTDKNGSE